MVRGSVEALLEPPTPIPTQTQSLIDDQTGGGARMESSLRAEMESLLGAKFGEVRLHGGPEVDTLTQRVRANAFTQGQHVFLRSDRDPQTDAGRETLVHELSHIARGAPSAGAVMRQPQTNPQQRPQQAGVGTATKETPTSLENSVRDRVKDWRSAAGDGVRAFATAELKNAIGNGGVDRASLLTGFAGNILWALTVFNPTALVAERLASFGISLVGIDIAASAGVKKDDPRDPITETTLAFDHILNTLQDRAHKEARDYAAEEVKKNPQLSVDQAVDRVLHRLFVPRFLQGGDPTEINRDSVELETLKKVSDLFKRFMTQVQPIGTEEFAHQKNVVIRIKGGRYNGKDAVALRRVYKNDQALYQFKHFIDADLTLAAEHRGYASDDVVTVIDAREVVGLYENWIGVPGGGPAP